MSGPEIVYSGRTVGNLVHMYDVCKYIPERKLLHQRPLAQGVEINPAQRNMLSYLLYNETEIIKLLKKPTFWAIVPTEARPPTSCPRAFASPHHLRKSRKASGKISSRSSEDFPLSQTQTFHLSRSD
jgi:hypothetical protein